MPLPKSTEKHIGKVIFHLGRALDSHQLKAYQRYDLETWRKKISAWLEQYSRKDAS